jgi:hypothetical protein
MGLLKMSALCVREGVGRGGGGELVMGAEGRMLGKIKKMVGTRSEVMWWEMRCRKDRSDGKNEETEDGNGK